MIRSMRIQRLQLSSFLLDLASEYVDTTMCRNQNDLAKALQSKLTSEEAFAAFASIDRALFVPKTTAYSEPYTNRPQQLGFGNATLSTPYHHALVLSVLHENGLNQAKSVLDVGCGSAWLTAAMFVTVNRQGGKVLGVDRVEELITIGEDNLRRCPMTKEGIEQGRIKLGPAYHGDTFNYSLLESFAPFDIIHVGFTFQDTDQEFIGKLCSMLTPNAKMLAGFEQDLCLFDSKAYRKEVAHIPGMSMIEKGAFTKPMTRKERMDKAKKELDAWKQMFETKTNRKPTKDDLFNDPIASKLFAEFSAATKLS